MKQIILKFTAISLHLFGILGFIYFYPERPGLAFIFLVMFWYLYFATIKAINPEWASRKLSNYHSDGNNKKDS